MRTILSLLMLLAPAVTGAAETLNIDFAGASYSAGALAAPAPALDLAAAPAVKAAPAAKKKWTVMVFVNGKNDLERAGLLNLNMMELVGSNKDLNILAEFGRMNGQERDTDVDGNWTGVRRIYVKKDNDMEKITSQVVTNTAQADMGDYKRAVDFVLWSKKNYPAEKYMLILWDHGTGWMDPRQEKADTGKGISFDDETGNYIRTREIGLIAKEAGGVDVMAFDACLMQMAEVLSELKGNARVMVGSEETIPGVGYPYHVFLSAMAREPGMSAEKLGGILVEAYKMFYEQDVKRGAQLSAVRVAKAAELETRVKELAAAIRAVNDTAALKAARNGVIRFDAVGEASDPKKQISFYGDLFNYLELVEKNMTATGAAADLAKARSAALRQFIKNDLVIHNNYFDKERTGRSFADSHGISIYLPPVIDRIEQAKLEGIFEGRYQDFAFAKATGWHDFVTYLYGVK
ncbi:MAG: clostripain-related cysteine peptidase [Elusimicrobiales bacterium]|nr:clostripain-related cysteine peptidase [Elusimicrobiales bacterium]